MVTIPDESDVVIKHIITPQLSWIQVTFMIFTKIGLVVDVSVVTILDYGLLENLLFKHL